MQSYDLFAKQFEGFDLIYNFGDFTVYQDAEDVNVFWQVQHENIVGWDHGARPIRLTDKERDYLLSNVEDLELNYDEDDARYIVETYFR